MPQTCCGCLPWTVVSLDFAELQPPPINTPCGMLTLKLLILKVVCAGLNGQTNRQADGWMGRHKVTHTHMHERCQLMTVRLSGSPIQSTECLPSSWQCAAATVLSIGTSQASNFRVPRPLPPAIRLQPVQPHLSRSPSTRVATPVQPHLCSQAVQPRLQPVRPRLFNTPSTCPATPVAFTSEISMPLGFPLSLILHARPTRPPHPRPLPPVIHLQPVQPLLWHSHQTSECCSAFRAC